MSLLAKPIRLWCLSMGRRDCVRKYVIPFFCQINFHTVRNYEAMSHICLTPAHGVTTPNRRSFTHCDSLAASVCTCGWFLGSGHREVARFSRKAGLQLDLKAVINSSEKKTKKDGRQISRRRELSRFQLKPIQQQNREKYIHTLSCQGLLAYLEGLSRLRISGNGQKHIKLITWWMLSEVMMLP